MSKSKASDLIRGGEKLVSIVRKICEAVRAAGGTEEDVAVLDNGTSDSMRRLTDIGRIIVGPTYVNCFETAREACNFDHVDEWVNPFDFPKSVFGEVGEEHLLAQPPAGTEKGTWTEKEINDWLAGPEVAGKGLEAAYLADGFKFVVENPHTHLDGPVVFWASVASRGLVAHLYDRDGSERDLKVRERNRNWADRFRFLLRKVRKPVDPTYPARFAAAIEAGGFTWWNRDRLTPENFPNENFDGGDYDLEWRQLPSNPNGYNADEINAVVLAWQKEDATILGGASAGDGLFLAKEFKTGRRDQPNGWIVCPGSASVDGRAFCLDRDGAGRDAGVVSCGGRWSGDGFVLVRKVREP